MSGGPPAVAGLASDVVHLTHLQRLEAEAIHVMREVVAECERPVMLYSIPGRCVIEIAVATVERLLAQHPHVNHIKEAGGSDIRCFVVGDKVVASMKRSGKEGEFRSNLHRGGSAQLVRITPEERSTAVRSARIMGLNVAGVDLLRSNHGPVVMEVNSSPGLEGIEQATGKDVASIVIQFIEKNAKHGRTASRGKG